MTCLEDRRRRVEDGGGAWRAVNDFDRLDRILVAAR